MGAAEGVVSGYAGPELPPEHGMSDGQAALDAVLEALGDLFFVLDQQGRLLYANRAALEALGYDLEELVGRSVVDLHPPEDRAEAARTVAEMLAGKTDRCGYPLLTRHGARIPVETKVTHGRWHGHDVLFGVSRDVSDRERARALVAAQIDLATELGATHSLSQALKAVLDTALRVAHMDCGGIYLVDEKTGAYDLACHTGLSAEYVRAVSHSDADSPEVAAMHAGRPLYTNYARESAIPDAARRAEQFEALAVLPVICEGRNVACVNIASHVFAVVPPMAREALEGIAARCGQAIQRLRAEEALRESEERYRRLVELAPEAIGVAVAGKVVLLNSAGMRLLHATRPGQVLGQPIIGFVHPDYRDEARQRLASLNWDTTGDRLVEEDFLRVDGTVVRVELNIAPITFEGQPAVLILFRDVTERRRAAQALLDRERELRTLLDSLPAAAYFKDSELRYRLVNRQLTDLLGLPSEALLGKQHRELFPGAFAEAYHLWEQGAISSGQSLGTESQVPEGYAPAAVGRTFALRVVPTTNEYGEVQGLIGVSVDVSERKQREEVLRQIVQNMPAMVIAYDLQDRLVVWNQEAERVTGYAAADMIGLPLAEVIAHACPDPDYAARQSARAEQTGNNYRDWEWQITSKDGSTRTVLLSCISDRFPIPGWHSWVVGVDITARKEAESALRESEERYRTLVETSPDAITVTGLDGQRVSDNLQSALLVGAASVTELHESGPSVFECIAPEDRERALANLRIALETGRITGAEYTLVRRDGIRLPIEVSASVLRGGGGQPKGFIGITRDLSERRRAEQRLQEAQRLEALVTMADGVAHDLGNYMAVILMECEYLTGLLPEDSLILPEVQHIAGVANQGAELKRQLMAFSRGEPLETEILHLNRLVQDAEGMLRALLGESVTMHLHLGEPAAYFWGDSAQLNRVLMNLLLNARDAMPYGGRLDIETEARTLAMNVAQDVGLPAGRYGVLVVRDTGLGIPPADLPHVFDPFFTTKGGRSGSGLGLSVVYGIMQQHHGRATVASAPNHGSCFTMYFPALDEDADGDEA
jgi:PAS domain S-box-containing protein